MVSDCFCALYLYINIKVWHENREETMFSLHLGMVIMIYTVLDAGETKAV